MEADKQEEFISLIVGRFYAQSLTVYKYMVLISNYLIKPTPTKLTFFSISKYSLLTIMR